jgi:hypothetical protein
MVSVGSKLGERCDLPIGQGEPVSGQDRAVPVNQNSFDAQQ